MKKIALILAIITLCTACAKTPASSAASSEVTEQSAVKPENPNALLQESDLVYSFAPRVISTSHIGFLNFFHDTYYLAGVYDVDTQDGYYLCDVESCTHSDASCPAYITNYVHRGEFFTDTYSAYVVNEGDSFWLWRYDFDTRKKTVSKLSLDSLSPRSGFTTDLSGTAIDGDTLYITVELENGASKIISLNTLTGEMNDIIEYSAMSGIKDVCGNALITWHWSDNNFTQDPASPNATFCIYDIVPLDGTAPTQLFLAPLQTHMIYSDGKTKSFYYTKLNTTVEGSNKTPRYSPDGIIYRLDMVTGEISEVVKLPPEGSEWISIQNCIDNNLMVLLRTGESESTTYKVNLDTKAVDEFSIASPTSIELYPEYMPSYANDKMLITLTDSTVPPVMYSIPKSDYLAGKPNYTKLEGSEIIWHSEY